MSKRLTAPARKYFAAEVANSYLPYVGKRITYLRLEDEQLIFKFEDGSGLIVFDDGQCCCESRYPSTEDDLSLYIGSTLVSIEVKEGPDSPGDDYGQIHDVEFLEVTTSTGHFQVVNHNEHNGYYGGFNVVFHPF